MIENQGYRIEDGGLRIGNRGSSQRSQSAVSREKFYMYLIVEVLKYLGS